MKLNKIKYTALAVFLFLPAFLFGAKNPFLTSKELDASISNGLHELYNLNFEKAEKIFQDLKPHEVEHPMVAFGMASVHWWRLSVFVLENDDGESKPFLDAVEHCVKLSKDKIDRGDPTGEGYLTMGGASGLLGRWQATTGKYLSAYFTGKKAIKWLRRALKTNPEMKDANMGLGIFDYYVATLPTFIRTLAFLGANNDPQVGINELTIAAFEGTYSQIPSKLFLTEIYSNPENNLGKAFEILDSLRTELPKSPFVHMMYFIAYYNHQLTDEMEKSAEDFHLKIQEGTFPSRCITQGYFMSGAASFKKKEWDKAISDFSIAISSGNVKDPFFTWSYLYKGYALDSTGKRDEAKTCYKEVLSQIRRWGSHDSAKKYLGSPFEPSVDNLLKLKL